MMTHFSTVRILSIFLWTSIIALPTQAFAQVSPVDSKAVSDSTTIWVVSTVDDNEFFGIIVERTDTFIRLKTDTFGEIDIPIDQIRRMRMLEEGRVVNGEVWNENVQESRYFVSTSGHGLRKGQGYYQNAWIFFNQAAVGISDYASVGVGLVPTFLFGVSEVPIWITPKLSLPLGPKLNFGVGALLGTIAGIDEGGYGVFYGTLTIGSRDRNVSVGLGQGLNGAEFSGELVANFGVMYRTGRRFYILAEGAFSDLTNDGGGLAILGGRTVGKRLSFDFGLIIPVGDGGDGFALPWIAVSVPFGR